jgi:hypothetical protein
MNASSASAHTEASILPQERGILATAMFSVHRQEKISGGADSARPQPDLPADRSLPIFQPDPGLARWGEDALELRIGAQRPGGGRRS